MKKKNQDSQHFSIKCNFQTFLQIKVLFGTFALVLKIKRIINHWFMFIAFIFDYLLFIVFFCSKYWFKCLKDSRKFISRILISNLNLTIFLVSTNSLVKGDDGPYKHTGTNLNKSTKLKWSSNIANVTAYQEARQTEKIRCLLQKHSQPEQAVSMQVWQPLPSIAWRIYHAASFLPNMLCQADNRIDRIIRLHPLMPIIYKILRELTIVWKK